MVPILSGVRRAPHPAADTFRKAPTGGGGHGWLRGEREWLRGVRGWLCGGRGVAARPPRDRQALAATSPVARSRYLSVKRARSKMNEI
jgi:hypothetical protein